MKFLIFICLAASVLVSSARIGETVAECEERYGDAVEVDKERRSLTFVVNGIYISADFDKKGVCSTIMYVSGEKDPLTVGQATYLLTANVKGGWDLVPNHSSLVWDSKAGYTAGLTKGTLIIVKPVKPRVKKSIAEIIERVKSL